MSAHRQIRAPLAGLIYRVLTLDEGDSGMGAQAGVAAASPRVQAGHGFWWGLSAGLIPNAVIFAALFCTPWVDEHVYDWLALGVLYAGPLVVGLVGLAKIVSPRNRRCGTGLILAAPVTVASWFLFFYVDALVALGANTPGP
jgi:hypothetical protein